jgi:hypothetical protein
MEDGASFSHEFATIRQLPTIAHEHVLTVRLLLNALSKLELIRLGSNPNPLPNSKCNLNQNGGDT